MGMILPGEHLYVMDAGRLRILSLVDPAHPLQVGSWAASYCHLFQVLEPHACLKNPHDRILLLHVSNPAQPRQVLSSTTNGSVYRLDV